LGAEVNRERREDVFGETCCEGNGRPSKHLAARLAALPEKYTFTLSGDHVGAAWGRLRTGSTSAEGSTSNLFSL